MLTGSGKGEANPGLAWTGCAAFIPSLGSGAVQELVMDGGGSENDNENGKWGFQ